MERERPTLTIHDDLVHYRCPQLGDTAQFSYCRRMNAGLPCRQMYGCWMDKIDVNEYLLENFSLEEIEQVFGQPSKGRVATMFDTLNKVLEEKKQKESNAPEERS